MSDEELRRLERIYQQDSSETSLMALNRHRIRVGLDPLRPDPDFLLKWAVEILKISHSDKEYSRGSFRGLVPIKNGKRLLNVDLFCRIVTREDQPTRPPNQPGTPHISIELQGINLLDSQARWLLRASLWGNRMILELQGHDVGDDTVNKFLSSEELLQFLKGVYLQEISAILQRMLKTKVILDDKRHFLTIIDMAQKIGREGVLFNKRNDLIQATIKKDWFREALQNFANIAEKYLRRFNLNFDLEQTWPTTITFDGQHYVLTIETGYNDVVDPEDFDESNPEGVRHGFACEMADHFGEGLDKLTGGSDRWGWTSAWEYEESYEEGSEDIAISIKAEIQLSSDLLLQIFGIHRYYGRPNK